MEHARALLVAACSRERADVTPHAVWGKNWDRWSMERLSTDLAVDVHPFAGTPMAEAMKHRRQLREARLDAPRPLREVGDHLLRLAGEPWSRRPPRCGRSSRPIGVPD